jgi:zinc transporter, ZIP family
VAFELIDEALKIAEVGRVGLFMLIGAATFTLGNWYLGKKGAADRKDSSGAQEDGSPLAIVFGSILDGIPESFVLGLTVLQGGVSVGLLMGRDAQQPARRDVLIGRHAHRRLAAPARLRDVDRRRGRLRPQRRARRYQLLGDASGHSGAFAQGFAAGALLAMVADTTLPEAYETEQGFTGSLVAIGFAVSLILSSL